MNNITYFMKHRFFRVIITQCTVDKVKLRELLCMIYRSRQCSFEILFFLLRFRVFFFLSFILGGGVAVKVLVVVEQNGAYHTKAVPRVVVAST